MAIETIKVEDAGGSNPGVAADLVGGAYYQVTKVSFGADGALTLVDGSNGLPVSVLGTVPVSGPLTDAELRASAVPISASSLGASSDAEASTDTGTFSLTALVKRLLTAFKTEDSAAVSGDRGIPFLAMRRDTDSTAVDADGDYATLLVDEVGRLKVAAQPGSQAAITGNITGNGQSVSGDVSRTSNITAYCTGTFSNVNCTFEGSIDGSNWFGIQAVRTNANTIETTTGALSAAPAYGWELSVNGLTNVRVRSTAFTSGTQAWRFQPAPYATEPAPAAQVSATQPVSFTQPALVAGTAAIGDVGQQYRANATGAASGAHIVSGASTNATVVKAGAGRVLGWCLTNNAASKVYVKFHNQTTTPTAGSGVVRSIGIPAGGTVTMNLEGGIAFATGIAITTVTDAADAGTTAVAANDIVGDIFFA